MLLDDIVGPMSIEEHIGKVKGGYRLYSHKGKNLGTFPSKGGAEKHEREVQYFKHADESTETLNELDLFDKQKTYFKMGNGQWIVANYRNVGSLNGPAFDQQFFRSLQWLAPAASQALGLDRKLADKGPMGTNVYDFTDANSLSHHNVNHDLIDAVQDWVTKNPPANTAPSQQVAQNQQQGVTEQLSDASPITGAITRRILKQRLDLLKQYGPELVGAAIDNVADYVGDVDEIGSSDVSAWVAQVERMLKENPPEAFSEAGNPAQQAAIAIAKKKEQGVAEDAHSPEFFKQIVDNHEGDVRGIFKDLHRLGLHKNIQKFCEWVRGQGIADINEGIALAKQVGLETDDEQELAYEGYLQAKELLGQGLAETSEADRIQALWDRYERAEELYGKNDPRTKALAGQIRGAKDEFRVIGKQGFTQGVAEMDKSQKSPAGWNLDDYDYSKGKWTRGKMVTAKDAVKDMGKELNRAFNNTDPKKKKQGVAEGADQVKKVFKDKSGKPVGEIGIDPESSPGNGEWYVHHYATGYSVVGFDSAAEAKRELLYVHKHPDAVDGHPSTKEQGVAEGGYSNYDDNRTGFRKPGADVSGEEEPHGVFTVMIDGKPWKTATSNEAFRMAKNVATKYPTKKVQVRWPTGQLNTVKETNLQENESDAVYGAILRRIMGAHLSLLSKYGPEAVMNATEEVADWVGDVDEIGTSDVSGWVRDVFKKLQAEYPVQESHSDYDYEDEQDSELYSGCYVRDTLDGDHGEIFRMQGSPEERRVQILDRDGRGWYISPDRLMKVDDNDPAIGKYFAEDSWHAEDNAWHGGGNEAVDAWHGQSSAGPMAETEQTQKQTPKTVAKTWDQMTPKEKLSGVKGRTMYNQKTSKYYVVFDVPATGK